MFADKPLVSVPSAFKILAPATQARSIVARMELKDIFTLTAIGFAAGFVFAAIGFCCKKAIKRLDRRTGEPLEVLPVRESPPRRVSFAPSVEFIHPA